VAVADVIAGFEQAVDKATEILPSLTCHTVENLREKEVSGNGVAGAEPCVRVALEGSVF
jgi:hypothetical protein